ncbi:hypothetical protein GCK72_008633 [Caenorhabditis remanei]|uniref:Uncharacterized protein n=1 Tax=Caenorhabditis remanei TaxID=31234 RepID=A0A6A5H0T6_CAERE|nr:hypothetical protein GCK72_008633 [Caenorhabditis remanei]KAF1760384.1 hypothetical protein GCK72_008633 [Caenorhabditis remanei]
MMRSGSLNSTSVACDVRLDGRCEVTTGELLLLGFASLDDRDGEKFIVDTGVEIQNLEDFLLGVGCVGVSGVTLLPQELAGAEEWSWMLEFPSLKI